MKARDVMADADNGEYDVFTLAENMVEALLATTPEGEGVYIAPDGTLMRVVLYHTQFVNWPTAYSLVPIEGGDRA